MKVNPEYILDLNPLATMVNQRHIVTSEIFDLEPDDPELVGPIHGIVDKLFIVGGIHRVVSQVKPIVVPAVTGKPSYLDLPRDDFHRFYIADEVEFMDFDIDGDSVPVLSTQAIKRLGEPEESAFADTFSQVYIPIGQDLPQTTAIERISISPVEEA